MKCYKLTDKRGETRGNTKWGPGISHETDGIGELCSSGWLHFYRDPLLAVLLNPIHANFPNNMRLWEAKAEGHIKNDAGLKSGCTKLTTTREIPVPKVTTEQRVRFAILCVKQVCIEPEWNRWADSWLSNEDRSMAAAAKAWTSVRDAESAAWNASTETAMAAAAAAWAAKAAEWAAWAAEWAAREPSTEVAKAAKEAAECAAEAAKEAAEWAAEWAKEAAEWEAREASTEVAKAAKEAANHSAALAAHSAAEAAEAAKEAAELARKLIDLSSIARKSVDAAEF